MTNTHRLTLFVLNMAAILLLVHGLEETDTALLVAASLILLFTAMQIIVYKRRLKQPSTVLYVWSDGTYCYANQFDHYKAFKPNDYLTLEIPAEGLDVATFVKQLKNTLY